MFPGIEYIKTCLNGIRSRIEKVEKSISKALASIKAQLTEAIKSSTADWNQNDPDALDYVKNRTHWDDESQTQTIDYNAWKGERPSIPLILGVWYEVSWSSALTGYVYAQYMNTDEADGRFECKQNSAGELYVGFESGSPFCIFSDRTEINTSWFQSNRVNGLKLTGEITPGLHQLDKKYIPRDVLNEIYTLGESVENQKLALSGKMYANNPTGTGAFSLNRKSGSVVGINSFAEGYDATASGDYSFAEGYEVEASGKYSFAAGQFTTAAGDYSFVTGRNNLIDNSSRYLHIVGNGFGAINSNAYTLDRLGNGWFAGNVFVGGSSRDEGVKLLKTGEAIPIPQTASVGQVLAVKAVDKNGKPTEWEPATLPKQVQADWNQNDSTAADYVKNRTHYEESAYVDYVLNIDNTDIVGFSMPEVGETTTVKINGVESVETVKEAESSLMGGISYKYIGNIDLDSLFTGGTGWLVVEIQGEVFGLANPDTTISIESIVVHKINDKFINFDGFVRTFDYYFKNPTLYKSLYNDDGDDCYLYTCSDFILPEENSQLFGFMSEIGFSKVGTVARQSCFITGYIISSVGGSIDIQKTVLGTNTTEMEELAARSGFTHTTNPKA